MILSLTHTTAAVATCVGGLLVAVFCWCRHVQEKRRQIRLLVIDPRNTTFPLLPSETSVKQINAISTLTFFDGDSTAAEVWIRRRTLEVMHTNPWLAGRLLSADDVTPVLRVCHQTEISTPADIEQYIDVLHSPSLDPSMSHADMSGGCYPELLVKRGMDSLDRPEEVLFKVLFIRISAQSFALVVSMSHMLGDGCTYYKIYSMLSEKEPVVAMMVARNAEYHKTVMSMVRMLDLFKCPLFLLRMTIFLFLPKFTPMHRFLVEVDPAWVAEQKQQHQKQHQQEQQESSAHPSFVSTNDVLVSWFVNVLNLDFCLMAANARQHIPPSQEKEKVTSAHCGNYVMPLLYLNKDARRPGQIRKSLTFVSAQNSPRGVAGFRSESDQVPSLAAQLRLQSGMTTNWATFYQDIHFPSPCCASVLYHTPVFPANLRSKFSNGLIIFRQRKDKLAVLLMTTSWSPSLQETLLTDGGPALAGSIQTIIR